MDGESPIMFLSIGAYARRYRIRGASFETFHALVGTMDEEYLEHVQQKADDAEHAAAERRRAAARGPGPNPDEAVP